MSADNEERCCLNENASSTSKFFFVTHKSKTMKKKSELSRTRLFFVVGVLFFVLFALDLRGRRSRRRRWRLLFTEDANANALLSGNTDDDDDDDDDDESALEQEEEEEEEEEEWDRLCKKDNVQHPTNIRCCKMQKKQT